MIKYFASHPTAANLLMLAFIVVGVLSLPHIRRETFPDFTPDEVEVRVIYPGATAEEVEDAICNRIEEACDDVNDVEEVESEAREGLGRVVLTMREGGDFRQFVEDVRTEVEAIEEFPELAEEPVVKPLNRTDEVVSVAVSGPSAPPHLKEYCENIKDRLQLLEAVSLVEVQGFSERQIRVEVPTRTVMQYGLSVSDIAEMVANQSIDLPAGDIETPQREMLVRFDDERRTPKEFEDLVVVSGEKGGEIRLGDIADIVDLFEFDEEKVIFNGKRAGILRITKTKREDTLRVFDQVKQFIESERETAPSTVSFAITQDVSSIVRDRLQMLLRNGVQGLALVFLVMWLFFSFRFSFWVTMGLPVSFLGAFFFFPWLNLSVNMLTMVGLLLALGLLMDDAIVLSENVASHLSRGKKPLQAVVDGVNEVKIGVIASFTTTVCVFGPICFVKGQIGKILRVMPIVLILVLAVSLIEAFLILPHHLKHSLKHHDPRKKGRFREKFDVFLDGVRERGIIKIVEWAVRWRYLFGGCVIMVFMVSISMLAGGILKFKAFPEIDGDVVEARLLLPQGTPLSQTEAVVDRIVNAMDQVNEHFLPLQPGNQDLVKNVNIQYSKNLDAFETGPHVATVSVDLFPAEDRNARIDDILNRWRESVGEIPDVLNLKFTEPAFGPAGRPIDIRLSGEDLSQLGAAAHELKDWLNSFQGVFDISDDLRPSKPEFRVRLRKGATALGVSARDIASQLRAALGGKTASEIQVGSESFEIDVRLAPEDRNAIGDLEYFHITLPGGERVPLQSVATLERGRAFARIARVDGRRTVSVQGDIDPRVINTNELIQMTQTEFIPGLKKEFPGLSVSYEGEVKEAGTTQRSIQRAFLLGLIGVFILLSFQFKSYLEPVIVMLAIPFSLVGVIWGHILMGLDFTMPSTMGFVSLAGIVVNDSILLVEFIKKHRKKGASIAEAAPLASRDRFRAVLITSLTTIAGLTPLLSERSLQAQVLIPLATSIVFGLLASTLLVLFVVPTLYAILGDLGWTSKVEEKDE